MEDEPRIRQETALEEISSILLGDESKDIHVSYHIAVMLGDLNEAIVLSKFNNWILSNQRRESWKHYRDRRWWTFGSLRFWLDEAFPFWSIKTLRGAIDRLVEKGLLIRGNFNRDRRDRTFWYSVDHIELAARMREYERTLKAKVPDVDR